MPTSRDYSDDVFADSRMSFGDHLDELRYRLIRAVAGLMFFLVIGFVADGVCDFLGYVNYGVGRPMLKIIVEPVETQVRNFYAARAEKSRAKLIDTRSEPTEVERIRAKLKEYDGDYTALTTAEKLTLRAAPRELPMILKVDDFKPIFGEPKDPKITEFQITAQVFPAYFNAFSAEGEVLLESRNHISTLSAQEALMVYFKVSLLCGAVLASPWIFYQVWAFVAAGMYPHERSYVYKYLPFSVCLFLAGVVLCQLIVLPGAVKALLAFNNWVDLDPDLRLNEWLGFALLLPFVFGLSFQTPLVMFFLSRLGIFTWQTYLTRWRYAVMFLALFSAFITPTPDVVTMLYLFVPMFALYMVGVLLCYLAPDKRMEYDAENQDIGV